MGMFRPSCSDLYLWPLSGILKTLKLSFLPNLQPQTHGSCTSYISILSSPMTSTSTSFLEWSTACYILQVGSWSSVGFTTRCSPFSSAGLLIPSFTPLSTHLFSTPTPKLQYPQKFHAYSSLPRVFLLLLHQHHLKPSAPVYHPIIDNIKKQTYLVATKKLQNYAKYNRLCGISTLISFKYSSLFLLFISLLILIKRLLCYRRTDELLVLPLTSLSIHIYSSNENGIA